MINVYQYMTRPESLKDFEEWNLNRPFKDEFQGIDIEKEYQLILQKKSQLPASMRRKILAHYTKS